MMCFAHRLSVAIVGATGLSLLGASAAVADNSGAAKDAAPISVVVLVDDSGSMQNGGGYAAAAEFVTGLGAGLEPGDRLAVYTFNAEVQRRFAGTAIDARGAAILPAKASGKHSDIGAAVEAGLDELAQAAGAEAKALILITDGKQDAPGSRYTATTPADEATGAPSPSGAQAPSGTPVQSVSPAQSVIPGSTRELTPAWQDLRERASALQNLHGYAVSLKNGDDASRLGDVVPSTTQLGAQGLAHLTGLRSQLAVVSPVVATSSTATAAPPLPQPAAVVGVAVLAFLLLVGAAAAILVRPRMSGVLSVTGADGLAELALAGHRRLGVRTGGLTLVVTGTASGAAVRLRGRAGKQRIRQRIADGQQAQLAGVEVGFASKRVRALNLIGRQPALAERGAAAVEFALVFPILIFLVLGIADVGLMVNARILLSNAAREVAREVALTDTNGASKLTEQKQKLADWGITATITVDCSGCAYDGSDAGKRVLVSASENHYWLSPVVLGLKNPATITESSEMRIE